MPAAVPCISKRGLTRLSRSCLPGVRHCHVSHVLSHFHRLGATCPSCFYLSRPPFSPSISPLLHREIPEFGTQDPAELVRPKQAPGDILAATTSISSALLLKHRDPRAFRPQKLGDPKATFADALRLCFVCCLAGVIFTADADPPLSRPAPLERVASEEERRCAQTRKSLVVPRQAKQVNARTHTNTQAHTYINTQRHKRTDTLTYTQTQTQTQRHFKIRAYTYTFTSTGYAI